jgi:hypothetical protein
MVMLVAFTSMASAAKSLVTATAQKPAARSSAVNNGGEVRTKGRGTEHSFFSC